LDTSVLAPDQQGKVPTACSKAAALFPAIQWVSPYYRPLTEIVPLRMPVRFSGYARIDSEGSIGAPVAALTRPTNVAFGNQIPGVTTIIIDAIDDRRICVMLASVKGRQSPALSSES
jgi:hypothetical protein